MIIDARWSSGKACAESPKGFDLDIQHFTAIVSKIGSVSDTHSVYLHKAS